MSHGFNNTSGNVLGIKLLVAKVTISTWKTLAFFDISIVPTLLKILARSLWAVRDKKLAVRLGDKKWIRFFSILFLVLLLGQGLLFFRRPQRNVRDSIKCNGLLLHSHEFITNIGRSFRSWAPAFCQTQNSQKPGTKAKKTTEKENKTYILLRGCDCPLKFCAEEISFLFCLKCLVTASRSNCVWRMFCRKSCEGLLVAVAT